MGTSSANILPNRRIFREIAGSLSAPVRNADTITNLTLEAALDFIPSSFVSSPILSAIYESFRFISVARERGIEYAVVDESLRISEIYFSFSLANELWKAASNNITPQISGSPYGKIAEKAFKKTFTAITSKGIAAMEESLK